MQNFTGKFFLLSFLFLFFSFGASQAQTTSLFFEDQDVDPGTMVNVDLKVSSFQNMEGMQFSVNWDPQVLSYQNVESFGIDNISMQNNFGLGAVEEGRLGFLWILSASSSVSLEDSTVLFSIKFLVTGNAESSSVVGFSAVPTVIEFNDENGTIQADLFNATISVSDPNSTIFNSAPDQIKVKECFPNPFSTHTELNFEIASGKQLNLSIMDAQGRVVYEQQNFYTAGRHQIILDKDLFPAAGVYFYELVSSGFKVSQRLIHISN